MESRYEEDIDHRKIIYTIPLGYAYYKIVTDEKGVPIDYIIIEVNQAYQEITALKEEDIIGKSATILFPEIQQSSVDWISMFGEIALTGKAISREIYSDITNRWYMVNYSSPKFGYLVSIFSDITDKKNSEAEMEKLEETLLEANKAKSEFLANMSHEIRTPMNGIIGMTDLVLMTEVSEEQREYLMQLKSSCDVLLGIINDILDYSKIEAGVINLHRDRFTIRNSIYEVISLFKAGANNKGVRLISDIGVDIPEKLMGDEVKLRQILANLISNAIKFTSRGEIRLEVKKLACSNEKIELEFTVADTGIGIARDKIDRLFKRFSQVDDSITKQYQGTGLGLAICKSLIELMEGSITVLSDEGKGSSFIFTVKFDTEKLIEPDMVEGSERKVELTNVINRKAPLTVLLAEDDEINRRISEIYLEKMGICVILALNGKEVIHKYRDNEIKLILIDINIPILDGYNATKIIRRMENGGSGHIPIIAMTAHSLTGDREKCYNAGMDDYLPKPISFKDFSLIINRYLEL